jgi:hypothetical protein
MSNPAFYPKPPSEILHKETHISHLFFAGELVYKIKKAVRYSFLDYSTLAKRHHFLNEELRLNRRLAPSVYLAVLPITFDGTLWQLGEEGSAVEYALVMRRLPEKRMLPFLLETRQVTNEMIHELAETLAQFHAHAEIARGIDASRYPLIVEKQWNDNLTELEPFLNGLMDRDTLEMLKDCGSAFVRERRDLFKRRVEQGRLRDVHGDLHCEHICFAPEGIQIFDCIEFSSRLRCCDLASEIAFLLMDLEVRGGEAWAKTFLRSYLELLDDAEMPLLLPFYECYRALVRGKVHALRAGGASEQARRYLRYATRYTWQSAKPFVVIVCGLTGSGKSTLARELGERLGMPVINSDVVRKAMTGSRGRAMARFNEGIYSASMTEKTYAGMAREAEKEIVSGRGVILDATFVKSAHRARMLRLAARHRVPMFFIHCAASEETIQKRLVERVAEGKDISDGRWEIYREQKAAFEAIDEISSQACLELNSEAPLESLARSTERFLRARLKHTPAALLQP